MPLALADVIMVPHDIFRNTMSENLRTLSTPPKAAHAGKKLRYVLPFVTSRETILEVSSVANGFPETDEAASIMRTSAGDLKPKTSTAVKEFSRAATEGETKQFGWTPLTRPAKRQKK